MAGYTTLRIGSSGQDVEKLQNALINEGYNLEGGADGIYGEKTASTVRQYQRDKGLTQDGVAGNQTLGRLYGGASTSPLTSLEQAQKLLDEHLAAKPGDFSWADQGLLDEARDKWLNRPDFQYDLSKDPFYQQYRDQYINQGQLAMLDTMGQAAALTGGYGSTYAQTAGQQAYQGYLQKLNDVVPELYGAAYDRYSAEGEDLYKQLALLDAQRQQAYGEHQDGMDEWYSYLNHLNDNVQYEQQMEYQRERDAIADAQWQREYDLSAASLYSRYDGVDEDVDVEVSDYVLDRLAGYTSADEVESYLSDLESAGAIDHSTALSLMAQYTPAEKTPLADDTLPLNKRNWTVVKDGGVNWGWGVDNNAVVKDGSGTMYRLDDLVDALVKEGMPRESARAYVTELQKSLGI